MDLAGFRNRFPEFRTAGDTLVTAALTAAAAQTSTDWETNYDEAHGLMAADILANSPFGKNARLDEDGKATNYGKLRTELARRVLGPFSVT